MTDPIPNPAPEDKLPDNFNPFEHLQSIYIPQHNAIVARYFSDLGTDWKPNIATARSSLRVACTMLDDDNQLMMSLRHHLLFDLLGYSRAGLAIYYGENNKFDIPVTGHPRIYIYFSQDAASVPNNTPRLDCEISFRIMNETGSTFTPANATTIANAVKEHFVESRKGIVFAKGKNIYIYKDEIHGYRLQIYGNTQTDSIDVIRRCLAVQNIAFDENKLSVSTPEKPSDTTSATQEIYGKAIKKRRFRPIANVRFRHAFVEIPGYPKKVCLVDTTGRHISLVSV